MAEGGCQSSLLPAAGSSDGRASTSMGPQNCNKHFGEPKVEPRVKECGVESLIQVENLDLSFVSYEQVPISLEHGFSHLENATSNGYKAGLLG